MNYFRQTRAIYYSTRVFSSTVKNPAAFPEDFVSKLRQCFRLEEHKQIVVPIFKKALLHGDHIAVKDFAGSGSSSIVPFFFSNDVLPILCLWSCWMSGQVAMPLRTDYPLSTLQKFVTDSNVKMIITPKAHRELGRSLLAQSQQTALLSLDHGFIQKPNHAFNFNREIFITNNLVFFEGMLQNNFYTQADAMQLCVAQRPEDLALTDKYTHKHINAKMKILAQTWDIGPDDRILNILPSHGINDYIGSTMFPLTKGSTLQIHDPFDAVTAWSSLMGINIPAKERINVVIAEPNVYTVLLREYEKIFAKNNRMVEHIRDYCLRKIRLMISCWDELPSDVYSRWLDITGHSVLQNSYVSETIKCKTMPETGDDHLDKTISKLIASHSGKVRIVDSDNNILLEFHGRSRKTIHTSAFTVIGSLWIAPSGGDEFFSTGEVVAYQGGIFKIVGRCNTANESH